MSKVCVLLAPGFEEAEAIVPVDLLRRGGVEVTLAGVYDRIVPSSRKISVAADCLLTEVDPAEQDMIFVPGGLIGTANIVSSETACQFLQQAASEGKWLAAICAGPTVLSRMGLIDGKRAVCYPGMEKLLPPAIPQPGNRVVRDGMLLTAEAAGSAFDLGLAMLAALTDQDTADQVRLAVHYHG